MADSDSGTHVTDISESFPDDFEPREEALLQPVIETGNNLYNNISQMTSVDISGDDNAWNRSNSLSVGHQRRNSTGGTPRLIRHAPGRATSPSPATQSRTSSPALYTITRSPVSAFHAPNQAASSARHMSHRGTSPARFGSSRSASPVSAPVRHLTARGSSPAQFSASRGHSPTGRLPHRKPNPTGRATGHVITSRNHLTTANVHTTPRRHKKLNGKLTTARRPAQNRTRRGAVPKTVSYGDSLSEGDGAGFLRTLDSIPAHSGSRSAYDFAEANRHTIAKPKPKLRQLDFKDIDLDMTDELEVLDDRTDEKSWLPTGIYAVFLVTLWTAVLRLIDSVEGNGAVTCSEGEETRLWVCAASFSLVQGLAEAFWQRKNLLKVIFSMTCLFGYFIISHIQPLSCRLGEDKVTEISKWQSAINFFVSALLGVRIYRHTLESMQEQKMIRERKKRRRHSEDSGDEDFEGLPEAAL